LQGSNPQGFTPTASPVCTRVCTSEAENANAGTLEADQGREGTEQFCGCHKKGDDAAKIPGGTADQGDTLAKLAAALLTLSPADRARLAVMLTGHQGEATEGRE
jgi:hypothetical protein